MMSMFTRAATAALLVAGTSMLAAPDQTTARPGQMTDAKVWIQNRGKAEAVPVELREVNLDSTLKVQIVNGDLANTSPVNVRHVRLLWDYETLMVQPTEDLTARLNARGLAGWETTGIWSVGADGVTRVVLKRSR